MPDPRPGSEPDLAADNARLRRLLEQRDAPAELRHRLNNTLRLLRDVIRASAETQADVATFAAHLEGRMSSLARIVTAVDHRGELDLHMALADEFLDHAVREGQAVALSGPAVLLKPRAAQVIGVAIHELAINAVEHGAILTPSGRVSVSWSVEPQGPDPLLSLVWKETGVTSLTAPQRRGFGTEVLSAMVPHELDAVTRLDYEADGLRCEIRFPLAPRIGRVASSA